MNCALMGHMPYHLQDDCQAANHSTWIVFFHLVYSASGSGVSVGDVSEQ